MRRGTHRRGTVGGMHQPLTADLNPADEVVAVYDRTGNPIGRAPRSVVYLGWALGTRVRASWFVPGTAPASTSIAEPTRKRCSGAITTVLPEVSSIQVRPPQETAIREVGEELGIFGTADHATPTDGDRSKILGRRVEKTLRCAVTCLRSNSDTTGRWHISPARSAEGWWWDAERTRRPPAGPVVAVRSGLTRRCWPTYCWS